ncbi:MAG: peptidyl-prolyl cis-trans isomerase [Deinococcota bacterium]
MKASKRSKKYQPPKKRMRRRNIVILWLVAIGLLVSMVISFTPTVGYFAGQHTLNEPALFINDEPIMELDIARSRQGQLFAITEGEVAEDAELLLLSQLIDNEVLRQAAEGTRVSRGEVGEAVREYREARGVLGGTNDTQYLQLIANQGFTDQTVRDFQREQIRQRKFIDSLVEDIEVTDDEVRDFYEANRFNYLSDPQMVARQVVVDDEDLANTLLVRIARGEDFEVLASEYSLELAEVGGAISADDDGNPQPIGRIGLPTSVASAALGLEGRGTTDVISTGGRFHIVKVEEYLAPTVQAFEDVETEIREATLAAKETALLQDALEQLRDQANVEFPDGSTYGYSNDVVATVGDNNIYELELAEATYLNQQVQQFLSPETADTIVSFFKPTYLEQLIEQNLALQGAETIDADFVGTEAFVASSALNYIASDVEPTEADLEEYYQTNLARFTIPASATVVQLDFEDQDAARDFRDTILEEDVDFTALAERAQNEALTYNDLGNVTPGQLESELDRYLFGTEAFELISEEALLEVSDVIVIETETEVPVANDTEADVGDTAEAAGDTVDGTVDEAADNATEEDVTEQADAATIDAEAANDDTSSDEADADISADAEAGVEDTEAADAEPAESETVVETTYTLLVAIRTPERVRSLDDVRSQIEEAVLVTQRSETQQNWLTALRETIPVENLIAQEPAVMTPSTPSVEFTTEPIDESSNDEASSEETPSDDVEGTSDADNEADAVNAEDSEDGADIEDDTMDDAEVEDTSDKEISDDVTPEASDDGAEEDATSAEESEPSEEAETADEAATDVPDESAIDDSEADTEADSASSEDEATPSDDDDGTESDDSP